MYGNFEIVNLLITQSTIDINETDIYGNTASILGKITIIIFQT